MTTTTPISEYHCGGCMELFGFASNADIIPRHGRRRDGAPCLGMGRRIGPWTPNGPHASDVTRWAREIMHSIEDDIMAGVIPASVATFSELHDYVDANMYLIDQEVPFGSDCADTEDPDGVRFVSDVSNEVTRRLMRRTAAMVERAEVNLSVIAQRISHDYGIDAFVEHTGGNTATVYLGSMGGFPGDDGRYDVAVGPGYFTDETLRSAWAHVGEVHIGPDGGPNGVTDRCGASVAVVSEEQAIVAAVDMYRRIVRNLLHGPRTTCRYCGTWHEGATNSHTSVLDSAPAGSAHGAPDFRPED